MAPAEFKEKFFALTDKAGRIIITSHLAPDEDSIGSVLAVHDLLKGFPLGKIRMVYTGNRLPRFEPIAGYDKVEFVPDLADHLNQADLVIILDTSSWGRVSKKPEEGKKFTGKTICLDHHTTEGEKFDLTLIEPECPSTCELIYRIFYTDAPPAKPAAEALLMGILGDTGNFAYLKPNQTATFDIAKKIIQITGVSIQEFQGRYRGFNPKTLIGINHLLGNMALHQTPGWLPFQTTYLTREFAEAEKLNDEEISEITHIYMGPYLTGVKGYPWGILTSPRADGSARVSMRSRTPQVNVRRILERLGLGGGHDQAAGGTFALSTSLGASSKPGNNLDPKSCLNQVLGWLEQNKPE